jgi:hypothetical protein
MSNRFLILNLQRPMVFQLSTAHGPGRSSHDVCRVGKASVV